MYGSWVRVPAGSQKPLLGVAFAIILYLETIGSKKTSCTITFDLQNGKCLPLSVDRCDLLTLDESILQNIHDGWVEQIILSSDREDILPLDDLIQKVSLCKTINRSAKTFNYWETYLTKEATYIWKLSTAADIQNKFGLILELRNGNRMSYRRKKEIGFDFIEHDYHEQNMEGFLNWKKELENIMAK